MKQIIKHLTRSDRLLHLSAGYVIATLVVVGLSLLLKGWLPYYMALTVGIFAGAAKEYYDYQQGRVPELWDFIATVLGAVLGTFLLIFL